MLRKLPLPIHLANKIILGTESITMFPVSSKIILQRQRTTEKSIYYKFEPLVSKTYVLQLIEKKKN